MTEKICAKADKQREILYVKTTSKGVLRLGVIAHGASLFNDNVNSCNQPNLDLNDHQLNHPMPPANHRCYSASYMLKVFNSLAVKLKSLELCGFAE